VAKNDQEEAFEKVLSATLARVVDFLKYGEAKNALLATFSSGWVLALVGLLVSGKDVPSVFAKAAALALPTFGIATAICIYSILPKTNFSLFTRLNSTQHNPNLLFYGDIAAFDILDDYETNVRKHYTPSAERSVADRYITDLCIQIAVNSQIVKRKFDLFNRALWFAGGGLAVMLVSTAMYSYNQVRGMF